MRSQDSGDPDLPSQPSLAERIHAAVVHLDHLLGLAEKHRTPLEQPTLEEQFASMKLDLARSTAHLQRAELEFVGALERHKRLEVKMRVLRRKMGR